MSITPIGKEFTYYVTFQDTDNIPRPWVWFTRKGFRHCSVWMACEGGTMNVNQSMYGINFYTWPYPLDDVMNQAMSENCFTKVVKVVVTPESKYRNKLGTIIPTCVSLCQRITSLTYHAFTPYSYYKSLLKSGAQEIDMGGIMPKKPKVDTSALEAQRKEAQEAELRKEEEEARTADLRSRQRMGRKSLLGTKGGELGVSE